MTTSGRIYEIRYYDVEPFYVQTILAPSRLRRMIAKHARRIENEGGCIRAALRGDGLTVLEPQAVITYG